MTYDDHEMELDIEAQRLRRPEEIHRMSKEGGRAIGPDWDRHVVRPAVGVRVAVHGYHEARSLNLVIHLLGGKPPLRCFAVAGCSYTECVSMTLAS